MSAGTAALASAPNSSLLLRISFLRTARVFPLRAFQICHTSGLTGPCGLLMKLKTGIKQNGRGTSIKASNYYSFGYNKNLSRAHLQFRKFSLIDVFFNCQSTGVLLLGESGLHTDNSLSNSFSSLFISLCLFCAFTYSNRVTRQIPRVFCVQ